MLHTPPEVATKGTTQRYKENAAELKKFTDTARKGGIAISKVLLVEAEKLAQQQEALEREQAEIEVQIKLREGHLMDATMVAEALTNFTEVFKHFSFEDEIHLLNLLIERIWVTPETPKMKKSQTI